MAQRQLRSVLIRPANLSRPLTKDDEILEYVIPRAKNLKAIVFECEHNQPEECLPVFERLNALFPVELETGGEAAAR